MRTAQESVHLVTATIGFTSFAALWAGTLCGTVLRSGWARSRIRHATVHGIHMHLVLFGLWLGLVHGLAQLATPDGKVRVVDVLIPFVNRADPLGVGMGVLALEMLLASAGSVLVQRRLGHHRWRALHSLGYLAFTLVAAHLLVSGAEVAAAPVRTAVVLAWATVAAAGALTLAPVARLPRALLDMVSSSRRAEEITVAVDPGRCGSFGFCEHEAPGIFSLRSDQRLAYRSVVPGDQADEAMRAAMVCPARAITLGRLPTAVVIAPAEPEPVEAVSPLAPVPRPAPVQRPAPVFTEPAAVRPPTPLRPHQPPSTELRPQQPPPPQWHPPSELEDTGRHHIRPLRGIAGGRPGGRR